MMVKTIKTFLILSFISISLLLPFSCLHAGREGAITISPSMINLEAGKGERIESSFDFINGTSTTQNISLNASPFLKEKDGTLIFYDDNKNPITSPVKDWISFEDFKAQILSGEKEKIGFNISVPTPSSFPIKI